MRVKEIPKLDLTKYVGKKVQIENAQCIETKHGMALKVESVALDKLSDDKVLRASSIYSIMKDEEGLFIGKGTKLDNFLNSKGIESEDLIELNKDVIVMDLIGKECVVQLNVKTNFLDLI